MFFTFPQDAAVPHLFTRYVKQAGALRRFFAFPWHALRQGGLTADRTTRAPFYEMWVKTENWRTPQELILLYRTLYLLSIGFLLCFQCTADLPIIKITQFPRRFHGGCFSRDPHRRPALMGHNGGISAFVMHLHTPTQCIG